MNEKFEQLMDRAVALIERIEAVFVGAGDTLTAALAALLATGMDLPEATGEALAADAPPVARAGHDHRRQAD